MGFASTEHDRQAAARRLRQAALRRRRQRLGAMREDQPPLRLAAHGRRSDAPRPEVEPPPHQRLQGEADPRWVLAVRTAAGLEGAILNPEKREKLVALGRRMGLSPFDANLVIAIVQDQARRGVLADYCPQAGAAQLAMVPAPRRFRTADWLRWPHALHTALAAASILGLQALAIWYLVR